MINPIPVSQAPIVYAPNSSGKLPGSMLAAQGNAAFDALARDFVGPSWPTAAGLGVAALAGITAYNTTTKQLARRSLDDTAWIPLGVIDETNHLFAAAVAAGLWWSGSGAPSSGTGANGDYYLNTATGDVYTKASGAWGSAVGSLGARPAFLSGSGAPSSGTGINGDAYLNTAVGDIYIKAAGAWGSAVGNIQGVSAAKDLWWQYVTVQLPFDGALTDQSANALTLTDIQRAARFLTLQRLVYGGKPGATSFPARRSQPRTFGADTLRRAVEALHDRLARVTIECLDYQEFIRRYDGPGALFYLDPPYYLCEDYYGKGLFSRDDFEHLADLLGGIKGRWLMSINDHPEVRRLFARFRIDEEPVAYRVGGVVKPVVELVIGGGG